MAWFKVDDQLHDHRKSRAAGKAAMGVWVLAGSWSMEKLTDGFVPRAVISRWGTQADAKRLVEAGLWFPDQHEGEQGWRFHDWSRFQPSAAVTAATKAAESEAGIRGNHKRWHVSKGISDPDCEYCYRVPDQEPDGLPDELPESGGESGAISGQVSGSDRPVPVPDPDRTISNEIVRVRPEIDALCDHLASAIEANGSKRPTITEKWRRACRLMLDIDKRTEHEIRSAIDWSQTDEFWRANVLSMPKLREKYDQMRLQASRQPRLTTQNATDDLFARAAARMGVTA